MFIRSENKNDFFAVEMLVRDAFWGLFSPRCVEHYLAHILRDAPCFIPELDLVALQEERLIAQVMYSRGTVTVEDGTVHTAITFGPLAVSPQHQGQGVGAALLRDSLARARDMGFAIVCLHGHPDYYARLGFRPAREYGISDEYGVGDALLAMPLDARAARDIHGIWREDAIFNVSPAAVAAYDAQLPPRADARRASAQAAFAAVPASAAQAMQQLGIVYLNDLRRFSTREIAALPGMDAQAMAALNRVLRAAGQPAKARDWFAVHDR